MPGLLDGERQTILRAAWPTFAACSLTASSGARLVSESISGGKLGVSLRGRKAPQPRLDCDIAELREPA